MRTRTTRALCIAVAVLGTISISGFAATPSEGPAPDAAMTADNPFARPSPLPYRLPPFDRIRDSDYRAAFLAGMAEKRVQLAAIARDPAPPTFDNTIVAIEQAGPLLARVDAVFFSINQLAANDEILAIEADMTPKRQALDDEMYLDDQLFRRIDQLFVDRARLALDPESLRLLERYHTVFELAGARLSAADKATLRDYNAQLSRLKTQFRQNVLKATRDGAIVVDDRADLRGLSDADISAAAEAGKSRDMPGTWLLTLDNTTTQPLLERLENRALRERVYRASIARGVTAGDTDNRRIIVEVVKIRAQRARLLGYPTAAALVQADSVAKTPKAVDHLLSQTAPAALAAARRDAAVIQRMIDAQSAAAHARSFVLQPWDWQFYAHKVREARYAYDLETVKSYFELDHVLRDGVFYAAHELYGLTFKERTDLPVYHPDVRVFEAFDGDGQPLALFLADYFARDGKQGGAWMNNFVGQSSLLGERPVIYNALNIHKPAPGQPVLLSYDEVTTMFHEFGHAIHGMLSNVRYPSLSGTQVPADFVEYPSQYNEMWARESGVLAHYARHYQSGASMPADLRRKVLESATFDQGHLLLEYLEAALLDQALHRMTEKQLPSPERLLDFESQTLKRAGVDYPPVPPRYHTAYFLHIFPDGYDASYYAYLWSEILARDTGSWFHTHGGMTRANGDYLRAKILSRGNAEDPELLFRNFYGGAPDVAPLLEYRGLVTSADSTPAAR